MFLKDRYDCNDGNRNTIEEALVVALIRLTAAYLGMTEEEGEMDFSTCIWNEMGKPSRIELLEDIVTYHMEVDQYLGYIR